MTDLARIDQDAVLRALRLDPRDPNAQAALLICDRYGLDPVMKHVVLIQGRPYITRDGYLTIAHRSGQLDGIEVVTQGEDDTHWTATVAVYRKDMGRPFTYVGRHPKRSGNQYGPEMAVKTAEVQALRRAFEVTGVGAADEQWEDNTPAPVDAEVVDEASAVASGRELDDPSARISRGVASALGKRLKALPDDLGDRVRMVWTENKWPTGPDGRLLLAQLTQSHHSTLSDLLDAWDIEPQVDEPADSGTADAEWPDDPSQIEAAVETIGQGGLT